MAETVIYKPFVGDYANAGTDIFVQGALPTGVFTIMSCAMPGQVTPLTAARSPVLQEMAQMSVGGVEPDVQSLSLTAGASPVQIDVPQDKTPFVTRCEVSFSPSQDLHGYDSPWPAGGGKNLFNKDGQVIYGYWLNGSWTPINTPGDNSWCGMVIPVTEGETYTWSGDPTEGGVYNVWLSNTDNTGWISNISATGTTTKTATAPTGAQAMWLALKAGDDWSQLQVEKNSSATSYAPYSNICPISGWQGAEVYIEPTYDPTATPKASVTFGQTILGGTAEIVAGTGSGQYDSVTWDGSNDEDIALWSSQNPNIVRLNYSGMKRPVNNQTAANIPKNSLGLSVRSASDIANQVNTYGVGIPSNINTFILKIQGVSTVAGYRAFLAENPLQIIFEKATPTPYTFTPASITLQQGENQVWAEMIPE